MNLSNMPVEQRENREKKETFVNLVEVFFCFKNPTKSDTIKKGKATMKPRRSREKPTKSYKIGHYKKRKKTTMKKGYRLAQKHKKRGTDWRKKGYRLAQKGVQIGAKGGTDWRKSNNEARAKQEKSKTNKEKVCVFSNFLSQKSYKIQHYKKRVEAWMKRGDPQKE